MTRAQKWLVSISVVVVTLAAFLYLFNWNVLRGVVERRVTQATGRAFHINGDMDVKLRWQPRIILNQVTLANASWSETPMMAQVKYAEFSIAPLSIFQHKISIPFLHLSAPVLLLEKNAAGVANWMFDDNAATAKQSNGKTIDVSEAIIDEGQLTYRSVPDRADLVIMVSSSTNSAVNSVDKAEKNTATNVRMLQVKAKGVYHELNTEAQGEVGAINSFDDLQHAYPIHLQGHVGKTELQAQGTVNKPLQLEGLNLTFDLAGGSLADLFPLLGVPLPPTAAYSLSGRIEQRSKLWNFPEFRGHIGNSDMRGRFSVSRAQLPQVIIADLQSENLDLKDLSGLVGGREDSGKKIVDAKRVLPDSPFSFEKLHAANADVQFKGKHIKTERLPIDDMSLSMKLKDGQLLLDPVNFGVADGDIKATINLNSNRSPIDTAADITLKNIRFDLLFPGFKFEKANAGVIGGHAKLTGQGDSIAKMLGSADGQVTFLMRGGSISKLVVRLANLDVANSVAILVNGDKSVPIRCMVTDLAAQDGNMVVKTMVLDNEKSIISGQGNINFKNETLDLRLASKPKDISLVALRGPIEVKGTFKDPSAGVELKNVSGRAAVATALGTIAGPLALIPLIDIGEKKDSNCAALLHNAEMHSMALKVPLKVQPTLYLFPPTEEHPLRLRF